VSSDLVVAVLGTGSIGTRHLAVLGALPGVRPLAVPLRIQRREELARAGHEVAQDLPAAFTEGARAAVIATDTRRHVADAVQALALGFDLLVEKPLACDTKGARQIRDVALRNGRRVFVGCVLRFSASLNAFRAHLARVGRLHSVHIECRSFLPDWRPGQPYKDSYSAREDEGGVLRDLVHEIDYAAWLFGWPRRLFARVRNLGRLGIAADEQAEMSWEADSGAVVTVGLDYLTRPTRRGICAAGELGTLTWNAVEQGVTVSVAGEAAATQRLAEERNNMFRAQAAAFVASCQDGRDVALATAEDGVRALAVIEAARRSMATDRSEEVNYP